VQVSGFDACAYTQLRRKINIKYSYIFALSVNEKLFLISDENLPVPDTGMVLNKKCFYIISDLRIPHTFHYRECLTRYSRLFQIHLGFNKSHNQFFKF